MFIYEKNDKSFNTIDYDSAQTLIYLTEVDLCLLLVNERERKQRSMLKRLKMLKHRNARCIVK